MLSHMVGSSNRIDITRLRTLERELGERDDKISRQQARLSEGARERAELLRNVEGLEMEVRRREIAARDDLARHCLLQVGHGLTRPPARGTTAPAVRAIARALARGSSDRARPAIERGASPAA